MKFSTAFIIMPSKAIHHSLKIGNRRANYDFFIKTLQMKVLRHEEMDSGCKIECNGPYDNPWSKTIVGYGSEADQFVLELTYNYDVDSYTVRDELEGIYIQSDELMKSLEGKAGATKLPNGGIQIRSPDGYPFYICPGQGPKIVKIGTRVKQLDVSIDYYTNQLGMKVIEKKDGESAKLSYGEDQCILELHQLPDGHKLDRGTGYGRIAFSYPEDKLEDLQSKLKAANLPVKFELRNLSPEVRVMIITDPSKLEICMVGDKGFKEMAQVDPKADQSCREAMDKDTKEREKATKKNE